MKSPEKRSEHAPFMNYFMHRSHVGRGDGVGDVGSKAEARLR